MSHKSDQQLIAKTRNTARFFTENPHVSWVLFVLTVLWGVFGYMTMPKRKDPEIPVRVAAALLSWPGASAEMMEDRLTRPVERKLAENSKIDKIESTTRAGVAVVTIALDKTVNDTGKEFDDVWLKLSSIQNLPEGAGMEFMKDFGDTSALMLTVASPRASDIEVQLRAEQVAAAIARTRSDLSPEAKKGRAALVACFPYTLEDRELAIVGKDLAAWAESRGAQNVRMFSGQGFLGIDAETNASDEKILANARDFVTERLRASEIHPDVWPLAVVRDPADAEARLSASRGAKYSYRDLDIYSEQIEKALQRLPEVARVNRAGVLGDAIYLEYSQERMASYGVSPAQIRDVLAARNVTARGGLVELQSKSVLVSPNGELHDEAEIGDIVVTRNAAGTPVYLRDLVTITRAYQTPQYVSYSTWKDASGAWQRTRAITVSLTMKSGLQIADFGTAVDARLREVRALLPEDLVIERVSDQPQQVAENVDLFMSSLYEAIVLVVLVALIGFWEWRSALLMALSIPLTLAMTFGLMRMIGMDIQQISIGSLIISLGLVVDDPVVAGDAIKRDLARGLPGTIAAWLGPTKLATAILFATITNIVAYLPFLTLTGDTGRFIFALPIVLTIALVASRIVSMSFVPLLGAFLLRAPKVLAPTMEERKKRGFARFYTNLVTFAVRRRWAVLGAACALLVLGGWGVSSLKQNFFPKDFSHLAYVDVWLPEDSPLAATQQTTVQVEGIVREVSGPKGLSSVTTFVGGGGPRFWFSISPEQRQSNYAQVILRFEDKHQTADAIQPLQNALSSRIPGARIDVREIESGPAVGIPIAVRVTGEDAATLREIAGKVDAIMRKQPNAERFRDTWGSDNFTVRLQVDSDRASAAGVTNQDVASSSSMALNGARVGTIHEGDHQLPIVTRLRPTERQRLSDVGNLYVYASHDPTTKVPLRQISDLDFGGATAKILRRNHVRTITVGGFPMKGALSSEIVAAITPEIEQLRRELPPGYGLELGGEQEEQQKSFKELSVVLVISILLIYLTLVLQFRDAAKPLIVFAALPFGCVAALLSLMVMGSAFGFMAFLGLISLLGVIVSHVIVLFDFVEAQHEAGAPLLEALIEAGILRLRPVVVTVGATVLGLVPLAMHGGALWQPLCYVQIGGLTFATVVTLIIVPVLYAIFVLDLKLVSWGSHAPPAEQAPHPSELTLSAAE